MRTVFSTVKFPKTRATEEVEFMFETFRRIYFGEAAKAWQERRMAAAEKSGDPERLAKAHEQVTNDDLPMVRVNGVWRGGLLGGLIASDGPFVIDIHVSTNNTSLMPVTPMLTPSIFRTVPFANFQRTRA